MCSQYFKVGVISSEPTLHLASIELNTLMVQTPAHLCTLTRVSYIRGYDREGALYIHVLCSKAYRRLIHGRSDNPLTSINMFSACV